jgi:hypothetical protein
MLHKLAWLDEEADGSEIRLGGSLVAKHLLDIYRNGDFFAY